MKVKLAVAAAAFFFLAVLGMALWGVPHPRALARDVYHHFKQSRQDVVLAATAAPAERADAPLLIYGEGLGDGWQDWSWATHDLADGTAHSGHAAVRMTPTENRAVYFHHDPFSTAGYGALSLWMKGNAALFVSLANESNAFGEKVSLPKSGDGWHHVLLPLSQLGVPTRGMTMTGICVQAAGMQAQPDVRLDEIILLPDMALPPAPTEVTVAISIDANAERHAISPLIYGMAFASKEYLADLRLPLNRWGGNDKSRYNWAQGNADNAARDWQFRNRKAVNDDLPATPSSAADVFVEQNSAAGAATLLTVPTLGWVAKNNSNDVQSINVPDAGKTNGYDPSANRALTSVVSMPRKGSPFSLASPSQNPVYQDEWIAHLKAHFGDAAHGGVHFYAMDNEPDLWDTTHTDVHPAPTGYDDILSQFLTYADAVKAVDPTAQITGPVSWGWTGYEFSALDRGTDNFHAHADQTRHGGTWLLPWFLKNVRAHDQKVGHRTLDVLDVHFYPQGDSIYSPRADKDTRARRLRSVRSLWDKTYTDESWIDTPVMLLPRLKDWVNSCYPGTRIGITEWNFGAESDASGGLATADALGVFGRDGLDMACYWAFPPKDSPPYNAFKILRNPDGDGQGFGDLSCRATSADPDKLAVYAAADSKTGQMCLMLVNKMPVATVTAPLTMTNFTPGMGHAWQAVGPRLAVRAVNPAAVWNGKALRLPPYSLTLLRFAPRR